MKQPEFTLFYDGLCPLCQKEVAWLKRLNRRGGLGFQDITDADFEPSLYGKSFEDFMAEIHGIYPDGRLIKGMAVFRAAYRAVGLGWLFAPTSWPLLEPLFDRVYLLFAKHRLRLGHYLGGSPCRDGHCEVAKK